jgi:hypothetical protein
MLTLQIADQSLTDLAAKAETRWAIYLKTQYGRPTLSAAILGPAASRPAGAVVATIALRA